jgi:hypothetical protein
MGKMRSRNGKMRRKSDRENIAKRRRRKWQWRRRWKEEKERERGEGNEKMRRKAIKKTLERGEEGNGSGEGAGKRRRNGKEEKEMKREEKEKEMAVEKKNNTRLLEENVEEVHAERASNITRSQTCVQLCSTDICIRNYIFNKYGECPKRYKEEGNNSTVVHHLLVLHSYSL